MNSTRPVVILLLLGPASADIREGLRLALLGGGLGLLAAFWLTRFLASQLYGVSTIDGSTFAFWGGSLLVVSLIACVIPARRATRVDPMVSLRGA